MITQPSADFAPEVEPKWLLVDEWYWWILPSDKGGFHKCCVVQAARHWNRPVIIIFTSDGLVQQTYYLSDVHKNSKFYGPLPKPPKQ